MHTYGLLVIYFMQTFFIKVLIVFFGVTTVSKGGV